MEIISSNKSRRIDRFATDMGKKKKSSTSKKQKNEKKSEKTSQADIDLTLGAFELLQQIGSPKHIDAVLLFH